MFDQTLHVFDWSVRILRIILLEFIELHFIVLTTYLPAIKFVNYAWNTNVAVQNHELANTSAKIMQSMIASSIYSLHRYQLYERIWKSGKKNKKYISNHHHPSNIRKYPIIYFIFNRRKIINRRLELLNTTLRCVVQAVGSSFCVILINSTFLCVIYLFSCCRILSSSLALFLSFSQTHTLWAHSPISFVTFTATEWGEKT